MEFLVFLFVVFLAAGILAGYLARRLTRSWPVALSLLVVAFAMALAVTPSVVAGWGYIFPMPVAFVLVDSIVKGNREQLVEDGILPIAVVGGAIYAALITWFLLRYAVRRWRSRPAA
jgi:hypothetical protein